MQINIKAISIDDVLAHDNKNIIPIIIGLTIKDQKIMMR